jgi:hypothetical protein
LQLILSKDVCLLDGQFRRQTKGIAMRNCAAPPLDSIERQTKSQMRGNDSVEALYRR